MINNGLVKKQGLTKEELEQIEQLAALCDQAENIQLKLNRDMLRNRPTNETNDFLYYEDNQLVGFLGIYSFRSTEAEVSGMVHPDYRRKGIFRSLLQEAIDECKQREIPKIIFIVHNRSQSGKQLMGSLNVPYSFSEYWMEYQAGSEGVAVTGDIELRKATEADRDTVIHLNVTGFSMTEEDSRDYVDSTLSSKSDRTYIASLNGEPIAKICIQLEGGNGFIFGFCVTPELRGRGYGRQILQQTIDLLLLQQPKRIALEVAVENKNALTLYQSCGFTETGANDYYELIL
ncbi:GNAT family N-acetyltransferase [Brevibacillus ginsengisoli]|uniref:GNAT family N-acetyltransferase n=1 Tax=Brevibacillus ginsengisoli TaxID=363854 RepID=UPI003CF26029